MKTGGEYAAEIGRWTLNQGAAIEFASKVIRAAMRDAATAGITRAINDLAEYGRDNGAARLFDRIALRSIAVDEIVARVMGDGGAETEGM